MPITSLKKAMTSSGVHRNWSVRTSSTSPRARSRESGKRRIGASRQDEMQLGREMLHEIGEGGVNRLAR